MLPSHSCIKSWNWVNYKISQKQTETLILKHFKMCQVLRYTVQVNYHQTKYLRFAFFLDVKSVGLYADPANGAHVL